MSADIKNAVTAATLQLLEPLARFLLEAGIGVGELNTLTRLAYVNAARQMQSRSGVARVNVSRVAAATGLTRVEVSALLARTASRRATGGRGAIRAERVLYGWWNDPEFQDTTGTPKRLKLKGTRNSFAALVKRCSGDAHNTAPILNDLLRSKAVRERDDGTLEVLKRTSVNVGWDAQGIAALGEELAEHFETLLYNLRNPDRPRFAQRVFSQRLDAHAARVLIPELVEHAQIFLEGAQQALEHPKFTGRKRDPNALKFAVAVQFFQQRLEEESIGSSARPSVRRRHPRGTVVHAEARKP
jgi:hypothetical protein